MHPTMKFCIASAIAFMGSLVAYFLTVEPTLLKVVTITTPLFGAVTLFWYSAHTTEMFRMLVMDRLTHFGTAMNGMRDTLDFMHKDIAAFQKELAERDTELSTDMISKLKDDLAMMQLSLSTRGFDVEPRRVNRDA